VVATRAGLGTEIALHGARRSVRLGATGRDIGEVLGEGPPGVGRVEAVEPPGLDPQGHGAELPSQVAQGAVVSAEHPTGQRGAVRTGRGCLVWNGEDGHLMGQRQDLLNQQACWGRAAYRTARQQALGQDYTSMES
jgi:hypothetical protein